MVPDPDHFQKKKPKIFLLPAQRTTSLLLYDDLPYHPPTTPESFTTALRGKPTGLRVWVLAVILLFLRLFLRPPPADLVRVPVLCLRLVQNGFADLGSNAGSSKLYTSQNEGDGSRVRVYKSRLNVDVEQIDDKPPPKLHLPQTVSIWMYSTQHVFAPYL